MLLAYLRKHLRSLLWRRPVDHPDLRCLAEALSAPRKPVKRPKRKASKVRGKGPKAKRRGK